MLGTASFGVAALTGNPCGVGASRTAGWVPGLARDDGGEVVGLLAMG
jgi:hypothetical protein